MIIILAMFLIFVGKFLFRFFFFLMLMMALVCFGVVCCIFALAIYCYTRGGVRLRGLRGGNDDGDGNGFVVAAMRYGIEPE